MHPAHTSTAWLRRPAVLDDVAGLVALAAAIGREAGTESVMTRCDVEADFANPEVDLSRDTLAVVDDQGILRAYAIAYDEARGRSEGELLIHPALPPEVQDALLDELIPWFIDQAYAIAERRGVSSTVALLAAATSEQRMFEAYARFGFSYVRSFWRMGLLLSDPHPSPFPVEGVRFDRVDPRDDEVLARLHAVDQSAFDEHFGFVPAPLEEFAVDLGNLAGLDPDATWIAVDTASGIDAGYLVGTDRRLEDRHGYVALLGVDARFRGRGIAKALLALAFDYYRRRGLDAVQLGVDAQNTTGATQLYRSVGMSAWETFDVWELPLTLVSEGESDEDAGGDAD